MIINTGQRTDIPAFYAEWFAGRIKEGFVCVRKPYNPNQVSRYRLDPSVVDVIGFCTKNPAPKKKGARTECACYLSCDIGAYNTCLHLCKYCYANADPKEIYSQNRLHDPASPFLIGNYRDGDSIHDVPQESWIDMQERLF